MNQQNYDYTLMNVPDLQNLIGLTDAATIFRNDPTTISYDYECSSKEEENDYNNWLYENANDGDGASDD